MFRPAVRNFHFGYRPSHLFMWFMSQLVCGFHYVISMENSSDDM